MPNDRHLSMKGRSASLPASLQDSDLATGSQAARGAKALPGKAGFEATTGSHTRTASLPVAPSRPMSLAQTQTLVTGLMQQVPVPSRLSAEDYRKETSAASGSLLNARNTRRLKVDYCKAHAAIAALPEDQRGPFSGAMEYLYARLNDGRQGGLPKPPPARDDASLTHFPPYPGGKVWWNWLFGKAD